MGLKNNLISKVENSITLSKRRYLLILIKITKPLRHFMWIHLLIHNYYQLNHFSWYVWHQRVDGDEVCYTKSMLDFFAIISNTDINMIKWVSLSLFQPVSFSQYIKKHKRANVHSWLISENNFAFTFCKEIMQSDRPDLLQISEPEFYFLTSCR